MNNTLHLPSSPLSFENLHSTDQNAFSTATKACGVDNRGHNVGYSTAASYLSSGGASLSSGISLLIRPVRSIAVNGLQMGVNLLGNAADFAVRSALTHPDVSMVIPRSTVLVMAAVWHEIRSTQALPSSAPTACVPFSNGNYDYDNGCAQKKCSELAQQQNSTKILCVNERIDRPEAKATCWHDINKGIPNCRSNKNHTVEIIPPVGPELQCDGQTHSNNSTYFPYGSDEDEEFCTPEKCKEINQVSPRILCGTNYCIKNTPEGVQHCKDLGININRFDESTSLAAGSSPELAGHSTEEGTTAATTAADRSTALPTESVGFITEVETPAATTAADRSTALPTESVEYITEVGTPAATTTADRSTALPTESVGFITKVETPAATTTADRSTALPTESVGFITEVETPAATTTADRSTALPTESVGFITAVETPASTTTADRSTALPTESVGFITEVETPAATTTAGRSTALPTESVGFITEVETPAATTTADRSTALPTESVEYITEVETPAATTTADRSTVLPTESVGFITAVETTDATTTADRSTALPTESFEYITEVETPAATTTADRSTALPTESVGYITEVGATAATTTTYRSIALPTEPGSGMVHETDGLDSQMMTEANMVTESDHDVAFSTAEDGIVSTSQAPASSREPDAKITTTLQTGSGSFTGNISYDRIVDEISASDDDGSFPWYAVAVAGAAGVAIAGVSAFSYLTYRNTKVLTKVKPLSCRLVAESVVQTLKDPFYYKHSGAYSLSYQPSENVKEANTRV